ncbi:MAG: hypothetical protein KR126chlam1_00804 [Chlamydiae bacterium]|nr:hypothetical protein [Chlamydiota bacterium]
MNVIGITAVTSKAAALSYLHIVETSLTQTGKHPEIIVQSSSVDLCIQAIQQAMQNKPLQLIELLLYSLTKLWEAGATVAIIPNNSSHLVIEEIAKQSPVKCISIIDPVIEKCKAEQYRSTCIIGPSAVTKSKMYESPLANDGINVVTPDSEEQQFLQDVIFDASKKGNIDEEKKQEVKKIFKKIQARNSFDSVIVSCSELTDILTSTFTGLPVINPFQLQAEASLRHATPLLAAE